MTDLIPYENNYLVPQDWEHAGPVLCLPGSDFEGPALLVITPQLLAVCSKSGIVDKISLTSIADVKTTPFNGVLMTYQTSVGEVTGLPPGGSWGIEVEYSLDMTIKGKWNLMVFHRNRADEWAGKIRRAAFNAQLKPPNGPNDIKRNPNTSK